MNCYYEILSTIQPSEDIPANEAQSAIAGLINKSMLYVPALKVLHQQNQFKYFCFSSPYPIEADKIYRKGRMYCFNLRTLNLQFALKIRQYLPRVKGIARVISTELRNHSPKYISELTTLTPIVITVNNKCWLPEDGIALLSERLHGNARKKCEGLDATFEAPEDFFFEHISMLNSKAIKLNYREKSAILLGHKVQLSIKPHPWAQQMAFTVLAAGLGEKNSALGLGYCIARR